MSGQVYRFSILLSHSQILETSTVQHFSRLLVRNPVFKILACKTLNPPKSGLMEITWQVAKCDNLTSKITKTDFSRSTRLRGWLKKKQADTVKLKNHQKSATCQFFKKAG